MGRLSIPSKFVLTSANRSLNGFIQVEQRISRLHGVPLEEEEIPHTVELEMGDTQGRCIPYNCTSIEHNVSEKAGFLKKCEDHPEEFMKILSHMICHLFGIDTNSPPLPPGEEVLLIQKDYANAGTRAFRRSAPAITVQESPEINNFLYQGGFNQMSILWLLSEFAVIKFCKAI